MEDVDIISKIKIEDLTLEDISAVGDLAITEFKPLPDLMDIKSDRDYLKYSTNGADVKDDMQCNLCDYKCLGKNLECNMSNNKSLQKSSFKTHILLHNGIKSFYQCNFCRYIASRNNLVKEHIVKHTGKEKYRCKLCKYKCLRKTDLNRHMNVYNDEKPYKCKECNYESLRKVNIKIHARKFNHKI